MRAHIAIITLIFSVPALADEATPGPEDMVDRRIFVIHDGYVRDTNSVFHENLEGGVFLGPDAFMAMTQKTAALQASNEELRNALKVTNPQPSFSMATVVVAVVTVVLGLAGGWYAHQRLAQR